MTKTEKQILPRVIKMEILFGISPIEGQSITERVKVISDANDMYQKSRPKPTRKDNIRLIIGVILWLSMAILFCII